MVRSAQPVFRMSKLVRRRDLKRVVDELVIHGVLLAVGDPYFLEEEQFGSKQCEKLAQIEGVSVESFYIESIYILMCAIVYHQYIM